MKTLERKEDMRHRDDREIEKEDSREISYLNVGLGSA